MKKFIKVTGQIFGWLLVAVLWVGVYVVYQALYQMKKKEAEEPQAMMKAIKQECGKHIEPHEHNEAPAVQEARFICGDKKLVIDVNDQYASWTWNDDREDKVIYMIIKEDVSGLYNTTLDLWSKTKEYPSQSALTFLEARSQREVELSLKKYDILEASEFLLAGIDMEKSYRLCKTYRGKTNAYCQDFFKEEDRKYTNNRGY